jgi:hypothetical protein
VYLKLSGYNSTGQRDYRFPLSAVLPGDMEGQTCQSVSAIWAGSTPISFTSPLTGLGPMPLHNPHVRKWNVFCFFSCPLLIFIRTRIRLVTSFSLPYLKKKSKERGEKKSCWKQGIS